jgi:hypothetical protein
VPTLAAGHPPARPLPGTTPPSAEAARIADDPLVVEGERSGAGKWDPFGRRGVVSADRGPRLPFHEEGDGRGRFPRVAVGTGVDPHEPIRSGDEAGLLPQLPYDRLLDGLALFDEAPGQCPHAPVGRSAPAY